MAEQNAVVERPGAEPAASPAFAAVLVGLSAAFLFCGYEFVRSTSNTLYKAAYGPERLPQVVAVVPFAVVATLFVYGTLLSRLGPRRTLLITSLVSAAGIIGCWVAITAGSSFATAVLYVLRETYVVLLVEQYWSFLNSRFGSRTAKSYYGLICGIGSIGAVTGGYLLALLVKSHGAENMLLHGAGALLPAVVFAELAYRRCGEPAPEPELAHRSDYLGVTLFGRHPMLIALLLIILATQVIAATTDWIWQAALSAELPDKEEQTAYSGLFFMTLNACAFVGQFVLTPLLLRFVPLLAIHLAIPVLNLAACAFLLDKPSLTVAGAAYILFKTLDYSVFRAAKEILYIPFSFDVRYRAKEIIDVFGYRTGKGGVGLVFTVFAGAKSVTTFAVVALSAGAVWLLLAVPLLVFYRRSEARAASETVKT